MENVGEKSEDQPQILNLSESCKNNSNKMFWKSEERGDGGGSGEGFISGEDRNQSEDGDNQVSSPSETHFSDDIEEVVTEIGEELPTVDPPSSEASADPPSSAASAEFHRPSCSTWNERNCTIMAGLGGLIAGYLTSVTGGLLALPQYILLISPEIYKNQAKSYQDNFCVYRNQWLFLHSSAIHFMALIGMLSSLFLIRWGRREVIRVGTIFLLLGLCYMIWFPHISVEVVGLLFAGSGLGLFYQMVQILYSEIVPREARRMIFYWPFILGSLLAGGANYLASHFHVWGWRFSLGMAGIPTLILLILTFFITESPEYLIEQGRLQKARTILASMTDDEFLKLVEDINNKQPLVALGEIGRRRNRPALVITTLETIFGGISGVDLLIYYGPFILQSVNSVQKIAFVAPAILSLIQAMSKGVGALLIPVTGRKRIFLAAYLASIVTLVYLGICFHLNPNKDHHLKSHPATISAVLVAIQGFSHGVILGPYGWLDSRYPEECARVGSAYGQCLGLFFSFIANQIFLHMLCFLKEWLFVFYAINSFAMMCFMLGFVPETIGMEKHNMVSRVLSQHWFWSQYMPQERDVRVHRNEA